MTDANLINLEKSITKKDWVNVISWINVRWNTGWTDNDIKSLYEDYKLFPTDIIWKSLELYYANENEFFNASKFFTLCHKTWLAVEQEQEAKAQLTTGEIVDANANGLIEYLELHGYESFAHAVWDNMKKRFKEGNIEKFEIDIAKNFDTEEEWESAKVNFADSFPIKKTLEQLKAKREEDNGE